MDHFSGEMEQRFLARALDRREIVAATQHLRECESCRENATILRRSRPGSLIEQILPRTPLEEHPQEDLLVAFVDDDVTPADRSFLESHFAECDVCREILTDLRSFRSELQQTPPRQYGPPRENMTGTVGNATADPLQRDLTAPRPRDPVRSSWLLWLMQPFAIGVAVTATALLILAALAGLRVSSPQQFALRNESLQASPALAALKSASQVWRGQESGKAAPMRVIRPMRTLIQSGPTTFQWTTAGGATSYTVHVVDDQTQEEAATSPQISPASSAVCAWTDPVSLTPGKRYRWYVTAIINEQEIDAPGIEEPRAKFSVLSESELTHLDELKKANRGDHLVNGLLNLRVGLLDDAKDDFQSLLEEPSQTLEGRAFLRRLIEDIEKLRE
jgi:Putative zinc-finger